MTGSFPAESFLGVRVHVWAVCVCVCSVLSAAAPTCDGRRKEKEGTRVSMATHLLVGLYKAEQGGKERRANRY